MTINSVLDQFMLPLYNFPFNLPLNLSSVTFVSFLFLGCLFFLMITVGKSGHLLVKLNGFLQLLRSNFFSQGNPIINEFGFKPFLLLFFFILISNLISLVPMSVSVTAQIFLDLQMSLAIFFLSLWQLARLHGRFSDLYFRPSGVNSYLATLLFYIEISSFLLRPFSLALRLFANMVAGHVLLHIFAGFCVTFYTFSFPFFFLSLSSLFFAYSLELLVCFIQAFVFFSLASIYLAEFSSGIRFSFPIRMSSSPEFRHFILPTRFYSLFFMLPFISLTGDGSIALDFSMEAFPRSWFDSVLFSDLDNNDTPDPWEDLAEFLVFYMLYMLFIIWLHVGDPNSDDYDEDELNDTEGDSDFFEDTEVEENTCITDHPYMSRNRVLALRMANHPRDASAFEVIFSEVSPEWWPYYFKRWYHTGSVFGADADYWEVFVEAVRDEYKDATGHDGFYEHDKCYLFQSDMDSALGNFYDHDIWEVIGEGILVQEALEEEGSSDTLKDIGYFDDEGQDFWDRALDCLRHELGPNGGFTVEEYYAKQLIGERDSLREEVKELKKIIEELYREMGRSRPR